MKKIFQYHDYRQFLKERFQELKQSRRSITHRSLMKKAGFASPNFLKLVMEGQRNLSKSSLEKMALALELDERELIFFRNLVEFNQAKTAAEKDLAYEALKNLRKNLHLQRLTPSQFEYFQDWSAIALREMVTLTDFKEDAEWIADYLKKQVTASHIKKTLKLLEELGVITRSSQNKLQISTPHITTDDEEMLRLAKYQFHKVMIQKALEALDNTPSNLRDMSGLTLAISEKKFNEIKKRIKNFRHEILSLCEETHSAEAIYQMNIQLFNLSKIPWQCSSSTQETLQPTSSIKEKPS
jgi:uncharacterized protein (TIGR02147 family)